MSITPLKSGQIPGRDPQAHTQLQTDFGGKGRLLEIDSTNLGHLKELINTAPDDYRAPAQSINLKNLKTLKKGQVVHARFKNGALHLTPMKESKRSWASIPKAIRNARMSLRKQSGPSRLRGQLEGRRYISQEAVGKKGAFSIYLDNTAEASKAASDYEKQLKNDRDASLNNYVNALTKLVGSRGNRSPQDLRNEIQAVLQKPNKAQLLRDTLIQQIAEFAPIARSFTPGDDLNVIADKDETVFPVNDLFNSYENKTADSPTLLTFEDKTIRKIIGAPKAGNGFVADNKEVQTANRQLSKAVKLAYIASQTFI